ncbi:hypothetical protein [Nocardia terpenica]|nr:hypothetical protein [Nocardia terpenica]NQE90898.1 hypothetical protein [Nocardia terpenica]
MKMEIDIVANHTAHTLEILGRQLIELVGAHPLATALTLLTAACCLGLIAILSNRLTRIAAQRGWTGEGVGTLLAAAIATGVSAQGMWVFMGDAMHLSGFLRIAFFSFLEIMVITSALRARAAQRAGSPGGVDGIAMWAMTCLSAVLSASDADNFGTLLIRLTAPLVAAWGWERSMALERRLNASRRSRINWTITPERLLVRLRLADLDPQRTASDADRQRRVIALALAVDEAHTIRNSDGASARRVQNANRRLRKAMRHAIDSGGLIPFDGRDHREVLIDHIAALRSTTALLDLDPPSPWPAVHSDDGLTPPGGPTTPSPAHGGASTEPSRVAGIAAARSSAGDTVTPMRSHAQHQQCSVGQRLQTAHDCGAAGPYDGTAVVRIGTHGRTAGSRNSEAPAGPAVDVWTDIATKLCSEDPARRRDPDTVREILRLWHDEQRTYPQIAKLVGGCSKHAVGRVIRQARKYDSREYAERA